MCVVYHAVVVACTSGTMDGFDSTLVVTDEKGGLTVKELQKRFKNVGHVLVSHVRHYVDLHVYFM